MRDLFTEFLLCVASGKRAPPVTVVLCAVARSPWPFFGRVALNGVIIGRIDRWILNGVDRRRIVGGGYWC